MSIQLRDAQGNLVAMTNAQKAQFISDLGVTPSAIGAIASAAAGVFGSSILAAADQATARTALGLGTAAYAATTSFATAAQGLKADSALQTIPPATTTTLGGVKVGSGLSVAGDGTLSAASLSAALAVLDEGSPVAASATSMNFRGLGVTASADSNGSVTVDIPGTPAALTNGVVYVDVTGVSATTGDIAPAILAAINAADNGPNVPPKRVICPPGEWRVRTNLTVLDKSIDFDATGCTFVYDPAQTVGTSDFNVVSTSGWPTSGTFTVLATNGIQTVTYAGLGGSPTRFIGCSGWSGQGTIEQGALVTNGTQTTTAAAASSTVSGDAFVFRVSMGAPITVTALGGADQVGNIPELYVNATSAFPTSGTLTVTKADGSTASVTYAGKTSYSFTGCSGMSGVVLAGATVTDGTNTTQTVRTPYGYPFSTTTTIGVQAANSATLLVANTDAYPASGAVRIASSAGTEIISYTGKTLTSFTGCTGGSASGSISADALVLFDGTAAGGTRASFGTRVYCNTAGLNYGDVVKILSDDILNPVAFNAAGTGTVEFQAEYGKIMVVNPVDGYVVIDRELYLDYLTNVRLSRLDHTRSINVRYSHMRYVHRYPRAVVNLGGYRAHMVVEGYVSPTIGTVGVTWMPGPNLSVRNCYNPQIDRVFGAHQLGDTSNNQVGYVLNVEGTQGGGCRWAFGERTRHVFTTNATDVARAGNSDVRNYGGVVDFHVETLIGINNESFAWDTHTDGLNVTGGRVVVRNDFQPRSEQMGAVQFRGYKFCGVDHIHYDGPGYALLVQGDIGAVDFYVNKITGAHDYVYRGGCGTTERSTTTASGAQTLPSTTFNVASAAVLPTSGTVMVHTTDNGPQTISYTGVTGNQLTGVTGGSGTVASGAFVGRVVEPTARLRIASIDVQATGGTSLLRHTRDGLLDIGELRVRYVPGIFKPQANLAHSVVNFATARDPNNSRLRIGKMHLDFSAYPSSTAQAVTVYAFAMDASSSTQNYKYNTADVDELTIDFGAGYALTPSSRFYLLSGTGQSRNGFNIGELKINQSSTAATGFSVSPYAPGSLNHNVRFRGQIRGTAASLQEFGDVTQSVSSATYALYHAGGAYYLASNTTACSAPVLRARINGMNNTAKITSLQAPSFDGQIWKIACNQGSSFPIVIASGQISNVGSDLSIPAGSEVTLTAVGGNWIKYTAV